MAWIFELAIECSHQRDVASSMREHFHGFMFRLTDGTAGVCLSRPEALTQDEDNSWWISIVPALSGGVLVRHSEHPRLIREVSHVLYGRLKFISGYRFALAGIESTQFNTFHNLGSLLEHPEMQGLVLRDDVYALLGNATGFETCAPGYVWRPYV